MGECSAPLTCILYIYDLYYNRKLYVCQYVLENKINYFGKELKLRTSKIDVQLEKSIVNAAKVTKSSSF